MRGEWVTPEPVRMFMVEWSIEGDPFARPGPAWESGLECWIEEREIDGERCLLFGSTREFRPFAHRVLRRRELPDGTRFIEVRYDGEEGEAPGIAMVRIEPCDHQCDRPRWEIPGAEWVSAQGAE